MITSSPSPTSRPRSSPRVPLDNVPRPLKNQPRGFSSYFAQNDTKHKRQPTSELRRGLQGGEEAPTRKSPLEVAASPSTSPSAGKRKVRTAMPENESPESPLQPKGSETNLLGLPVVVGHPRAREASNEASAEDSGSSSKKSKLPNPNMKPMPPAYEDCDSRDLVKLISSMLMELIRYNDSIPLQDGKLTRFHSRAPPGISVKDYLQRLTTHATLPPPILLSMVYYIDRLCVLYPAFTISSLTVHRYLITSATVASKGLSDSFWTNSLYARVGGISLKELAVLELEFLRRIEWRIVPKPEVLSDYYRSLVERSDEYEIDPNLDGDLQQAQSGKGSK